ncbi:SNF2 family N-terminal domain-containing protein [Thelonectria olida]|uniref:SNF2 family N-terminal domain-containing protein n=1 Tax=Thelonectria olida TaxID=1576542 RepID=A0A9P9AR85_9HYPO|nr:SNF2 family N-terminal domain-containing protein [Thelonectria olida]
MALLAGHKATLSASIKSNDKLEILVYSLRRDGDEIGDFLSDHDWFLQQPEAYDPSTAYRNPQWLCRPGTEFETSWQRNEMKATLPTGLGAAEKKKVAELLDSAVGPAVFKRAQVSDMLVTELKEYQIQGLSMMVEKETGALTGTEFPSLWVEASDSNSSTPRYYNTVIKKKVARPPKISRGGLLADEMGLGKTLTALALISGSLHPSSLGEPAVTYPTLIVSPLSTLTNWECQIETHFKPGSISFAVYHGSGRHQLAASLQNYNIILTTYDILRAECSKSPQGYYKTATQTGILHSIDWHRVILDEAHVIRNRSSKLFRAVQTLNARHRWCLTGTPINNSIEDLGSLVEFLRVHPFDNPAVFKNTFMNSSRAGSCWERLRTLVQCITLRRTKASVGGDLDIPPRHEVIQSVYLDEGERHIYDLIKRHFTIAVDAGESSMSTFSLILRLRQACNHGRDLLHETLQKWLDKASMFSSLPPLELRTCEVCDTMLDGADLSCEALECLHQVCRACLQRGGTTREKAKPICPLCNSFPFEVDEMSRTTTASPMGNGPALYRPSSKVKALLQNLKDFGSSQPSTEPPAKSVVFSTWTSMLDLIGRALSINGFNFQRLDGTKSLSQRRQALAVFRKDPSCTVLLASIGCAGVGIDLTAASRVHIVEPGWNPMLERQALDRVHRLGQTKEVISFRYVVAGTDSVEEVSTCIL